ncbi:P-loop NTPase fold protein [Veronia pacifica]|uniref:NTPase n=1 Tax=Veronia pacifica TaxID=1080227 RepID=A0A1C3EE74_9GAMM|nr:P-loop NTPase fold protein [Veronia pacifica]ODA31538.1 NTPase [Veronia pacifica]
MKQTEEIIQIFSDESFPQVVLLDGSWGSGKTYFIKNELIDKLHNHFKQKVHFFSLYGVSSIDDFRDKIISLSITDSEKTPTLLTNAAKIFEGITTNVGEKGLGAVLGGAAGALKYKLYEKLDNCILILDDLERVNNDKVIKNILGECLNLAESKNIKLLLIANEEKLHCKDDIEKVFADKYNFSFSHEEVVDILKSEYEFLDDRLSRELLLCITSVDSKNIRVLKRAITKFNRLKKEIEKIEGVDIDQALTLLLNNIIQLCCAKYEFGFSTKQIFEAGETRLLRKITKDKDESFKDELQKLDKIFGDGLYVKPKKLVDFCCDGIYSFKNIVEELDLPLKKDLFDQMKSIWAQNKLSDADFEKGVKELEEYISKHCGKDISEWFNICDVYLYMIDKKIINSIVHTPVSILEVCKNVDFNVFSISDDRDYDYSSGNMYDQKIIEIANKKRQKLVENIKVNTDIELSERFKNSWSEVAPYIYDKYMHKPMYNEFNVDTLREAFMSWSTFEVFEFTRFNKKRYSFDNIEDFFIPEMDSLKGISEMIENLCIDLGYGRKVASLNALREELLAVYERLKN